MRITKTESDYRQMSHDRLVSEILLRDQQMEHLERDHRMHREHDRNLYATAARAVALLRRVYEQAGKRSVPLRQLSLTLASPAHAIETLERHRLDGTVPN